MNRGLALCVCGLLLAGSGWTQEKDVILQAMRDELERSRMLRVASLDLPYFIQYSVEDADLLSISASLGALMASSHTVARLPEVEVRVGSPAFDNTGHVYSSAFTGTRYDPGQLPLENNYSAIRQVFWLATDRAYKTAEEAISRKRSALKNITQQSQLPDFSAAPAVQAIQPVRRVVVDEAAWKSRVIRLSGIFNSYPQVLSSGLEFQSIQSTDYLVNSEGTTIRTPENLAFLRVRAFAQAADGMQLRNSEVFQAQELKQLPSDLELQRGVTAVASELTDLARAPVGEAYDGPVLFEPRAAAQLFAQLLGDNLKVTRRPVGESRRQPRPPSELENKIGSRILPEWMDVVDDPGQAEWRGQPLFGHYEFDSEGVRAKPLPLVEKGVLKTFLLTRTPVLKGLETTNGHARMHNNYGGSAPGLGNLFVRASNPISSAEMKKKLIELAQQRNKPYGLVVRKLDYPSGLTTDELRRYTAAMAQSGGGTRPVALPLLVYRVYPDGHEELVRGLRMRSVSTRSLKDIVSATQDSYVFNFLDSTMPFALMGAGQFVTSSSVIAPGLLFDEMEFEPNREDLPKLPLVPPPSLGTAGSY